MTTRTPSTSGLVSMAGDTKDSSSRLADLLARRADVYNPGRGHNPYYGDADIDLLRSIIAEKDAEIAMWQESWNKAIRTTLNLLNQRTERDATISKLRTDAIRRVRKIREAAATFALEQRCERGTAWDFACITIANGIRALPIDTPINLEEEKG